MSFNNRYAFLKHKYFHISITSSINKNKGTNKSDVNNDGEEWFSFKIYFFQIGKQGSFVKEIFYNFFKFK